VIIDADISISTDTIVLHCDQLEILHAEIRLGRDSSFGMLNRCSSASSVSITTDQHNSDVLRLICDTEPR
jgi:hypothetical protein